MQLIIPVRKGGVSLRKTPPSHVSSRKQKLRLLNL